MIASIIKTIELRALSEQGDPTCESRKEPDEKRY